ncbi:MAG: hypothetical protein EXR72_03735 [Myxococcales bacterium]|nr:hypothetical protein [Myxococcales bacterium]
MAKVAYGGFEPVDRLVAAAIVDGAPPVPIDPALAARLARTRASEATGIEVTIDAAALEEAIDEAIFVDQREIEEVEQRHFERALGQLERFVEDRALVLRQERVAVGEGLERARKRRDDAMGAAARARAQEEIEQLDGRLTRLDQRIGALEAREDEDYQKWRRHHHEKRYQAPAITRLYTVTFRLAKAVTSC